MLDINEVFGPTIQGEGKKSGTPSVFVRFGRCNMSCPGYNVKYKTPNNITKYSCDSFHASDNDFKNEWQQYATAEELISEVDKFLPSYKVDIVLTGGEPLLYWKKKEFQDFMKYYIMNDYKITIETNGSIDIELKENWQKAILFSISVKLSNSGEIQSKRLNFNVLNHIISSTKNHYLKFVVDKEFLDKADDEISYILSKIPSTEVYLMPLGDTTEKINQNAESVIDLALKRGYKYSDRLHIRIWDNKRGV